MAELVCPLCPQERTAHLGFSLREYLQHINLFHAHQSGFQVICGIGVVQEPSASLEHLKTTFLLTTEANYIPPIKLVKPAPQHFL